MKKLISVLSTILILAVVYFGAGGFKGHSLKQQITVLLSKTHSKVVEARQKVNDFREYLGTINSRIGKLDDGLKKLDTRIDDFTKIITDNQEELVFIKNELANGRSIKVDEPSHRVLSTEEIASHVARLKIEISTAQKSVEHLQSEQTFLRKEFAQDKADSQTGPLQLLALEGSLSNLELVYELNRNRLQLIDDFRKPNATTLFADARNAIDDALSNFGRAESDTKIKIKRSNEEVATSSNQIDLIIQSIDDFENPLVAIGFK